MKQIDAAFLWPNGDIILIGGSTYYKFDQHSASLLPDFPLTITEHKWSGIPSNLDASLSLPEKKTYFFKGAHYWLWGSQGYPKKINDEWLGVPMRMNSAFYWPYDGKAYFFKGRYFYR